MNIPQKFVPVAPCRLADTRNPAGPFGAPFIAAETTRVLNIQSSACNIPAYASAYALNVTAVPHGQLNYLTVWPTGDPQPLVSTLNSMDGRAKANAAIIPAGINGGVSFYATNDTDLVLDLNGYFVPPSANMGLEFYPLTPCRISDTRNTAAALGGPPLITGQTRDFPVLTSSCNLPSTAQAYSLNFTVVPPPGEPFRYLSAWPTGETQPLVSTLNAQNGSVTANAALVRAGPNGDISVFATDTSNLIIDVNGYFAPPATGGLQFYSVTPCRAYDSRVTGSDQPFTGTQFIPVAATCNVPFNASAVVLNATVVPTGQFHFLAIWPYGQSQPVASNLNAEDGAVTSNMVIVSMLSGGVNAFATNSTHLILDVTGYFAP